MKGPSPWRRAAGVAVRVIFAAAALGWTFSMAPLADVFAAMGAFPLHGVALALSGFALVILLASLRWGLVLASYGASHIPFSQRLNLIFVGLFYNTWLPGAVMGDLMRGHLTRKALGGGAGSYIVVFLGRILGLVGLLVLCSTVQLVRPVAGVQGLGLLAAMGLLLAVGFASIPFVGRRAAPYAPAAVRGWLENLPLVQRPELLGVAVAVAVAMQALLACCAHALLMGVAPDVALTDSLVVVPLALVSVYFPATVAGLGVRELAFIALYEPLGVPAATAAAVSLGLMGIQALFGLVGGALNVFAPVDVGDPASPATAP